MLIENIYEHLLWAFPGGRQLRYTPKEIRINHDWAGLDVHIHVHLYTLWLQNLICNLHNENETFLIALSKLKLHSDELALS